MSDAMNLGFLISDIDEISPVDAIKNMIAMLGPTGEQHIEQFKLLEKSFDSGSTRRILGGFAAGTTRDFQGENMILSGVDFSYLNSPNGRLNYDHNPSLIVGRPMYAGMIPGRGLYVKGILREKSDCPNPSHQNTINSLDKADELWELAKSHKHNPSANAPLGFSAEGLRAVKNRNVVKSVVTDVAITERAANPTDCTIEILAKSMFQTQKKEAQQVVESFDFPVDGIKDARSYFAHMSKRGASLNFSKELFNKIRSL